MTETLKNNSTILSKKKKILRIAIITSVTISVLFNVIFVSMLVFDRTFFFLINFYGTLKESNSFEIQKKVSELSQGCYNNEYCIARNIYEYVLNLNYSQHAGTLPPETTMKIGGDCTEKAVLLCSLMKEAMIECGYIHTPGHMFNFIILYDNKTYIVDATQGRFYRIYDSPIKYSYK